MVFFTFFLFDFILILEVLEMVRKIVVTSGKGGVGKTTIVSALGYGLSNLGYKTLLIDMDFGLNNLDVLMGIENKIVYDIIDVIEGKCLPKQALIQDFFQTNLYIFPSTHGFCRKRFGGEELIKIISEIENQFDYIIIDCPAGIDGGFRRAVECANEYIVVTTPHLSAVRDAEKTINNLKCNSKPYVIINRARGDLMLDNKMIDVQSIKNVLNGELIGVVPEDDEVAVQMSYGGMFDPDSGIYKSIDMIVRSLATGENEIYDVTKKYKGMFGYLRRGMKKRV